MTGISDDADLSYWQARRQEAVTELSMESRPHWRLVHEAVIAACDSELKQLTEHRPVGAAADLDQPS